MTSARGSKEAEVVRIRETLGSLIELSGLSRREIERRLSAQGCGVDLTRLLHGRLQLKLHQLLDIVRVLDMHPLEFFRLIYKEPEQRSPLMMRVQGLFTAGAPTNPRHIFAAERELDELHRRTSEIGKLIEQMRAKLR